jgi:hypothetical protein
LNQPLDSRLVIFGVLPVLEFEAVTKAPEIVSVRDLDAPHRHLGQRPAAHHGLRLLQDGD